VSPIVINPYVFAGPPGFADIDPDVNGSLIAWLSGLDPTFMSGVTVDGDTFSQMTDKVSGQTYTSSGGAGSFTWDEDPFGDGYGGIRTTGSGGATMFLNTALTGSGTLGTGWTLNFVATRTSNFGGTQNVLTQLIDQGSGSGNKVWGYSLNGNGQTFGTWQDPIGVGVTRTSLPGSTIWALNTTRMWTIRPNADGLRLDIFLNGTFLFTTAARGVDMQNAAGFDVRANSNRQGLIRGVHVYSTALSDVEIGTLYTRFQPILPGTAPTLVAEDDFVGAAGNLIPRNLDLGGSWQADAGTPQLSGTGEAVASAQAFERLTTFDSIDFDALPNGDGYLIIADEVQINNINSDYQNGLVLRAENGTPDDRIEFRYRNNQTSPSGFSQIRIDEFNPGVTPLALGNGDEHSLATEDRRLVRRYFAAMVQKNAIGNGVLEASAGWSDRLGQPITSGGQDGSGANPAGPASVPASWMTNHDGWGLVLIRNPYGVGRVRVFRIEE
jgi:hypothetical protein